MASWDAQSSGDKSLKSAFETLNTSSDKVVNPSGGGPNRFILQSQGYFDIKAYVMTGKDFPGSHVDFEQKVQASRLTKLTDIDKEIHPRTKDVVVSIGSSCREFYESQLTRLIMTGYTAIQYSDNTVTLLAQDDEMGLKRQLQVLLDPKYRSQGDFDGDYEMAREAAQMTLQMLTDDARSRKQEIDKIVETLARFKAQTMQSLEGVKYLERQYSTGPVQNMAGNTQPYLAYLDQDLADKLKAFNKLVTDSQSTYRQWETKPNLAVGYCNFEGSLGWIVMGAEEARSQDLRNSHQALQNHLERMRGNDDAEVWLMTLVTQVLRQSDGVDEKLASAIAALSGLGEFLGAQAECFERIAHGLGRLDTSSDEAFLKKRREYVLGQLNAAVDKLKTLKDLAQNFSRQMNNEIKL